MPTIADFGSFRIYMYFQDENPPHVHIIGPDFAAKLRLDDAVKIAGDLPKKVEREAIAYVQDHRDELLKCWSLYQE
ncbi:MULTISPECIES: DUF4160 domain-containing protein [unclassified Hwanghaeella]|jgi:hypothetical protein|uniref:DUF4160 domain-containing protein n=1 Tax=unclassified Hwanghaeella TaxID=2605944 RepID=UPI000C9859CA|nr:hypothetical protein [Rhodospirillales bacterium]HBM13411.1 hypothetical protein [Rhodospirillaceae bacterium]|tara:strand:- start:440 stop:667 length:228 start_codon:yes stop_codon:yes gene_type:complete